MKPILPAVSDFQNQKNYTVRNKNFVIQNPEVETQILGDFSKPTLLQFNAIQSAFDFYNLQLFYPVFGKKLSPVMFSLNDSRRKSLGYYAFDKYVDQYQNVFSLINLTPEFLSNDVYSVMSVLVHEMAHHYQYTLGKKKGRISSYHDKEFAQIMEELGLICSSTSRPGGYKTGIKMGHYIVKGGKFETLTQFIPNDILTPFKINKNGARRLNRILREEKYAEQKVKVKYSCPNCDTKVWGKPNLNISCTPCQIKLINT
ncbi:SprT-like domain-containing protein [Flavobacterium sp.]|jgi:predicted SprT family Zn-dependent metalloprotease|uniref:SprT-like domain-containing protein n=1 Tax=Flavobacterium sp. TaxID=239 RepID=UPI0037BFE490